MKELLYLLREMFEEGLERFGLYYSTYRAFVSDVEDPESLGRIRIVLPLLNAHTAYRYWAFPVGNYAGKGFGSQNLPQKGDMVLVEFEHGNLRRPLWKHGHFGMGEKPEGLNKRLLKTKNHWFKTPNGHIVEFDDELDTVSITHSQGIGIVIDKDNFSIIRNKKKISLGQLGGSNEPALLGNTTEKLINDLIAINRDLISNLNAYASSEISIMGAPGSPVAPLLPAPTALLPTLIATSTNLEKVALEVSKIKSTNTTLD